MTPITNFRLARSVVFGLGFLLLAGACGSTETPETTPLPAADLPLAATGIGTADIGQPPGPVLAELNSFFGEPDIDAGWVAADSPLYGTCPGVQLRAVGWGSLYLFFIADEAVTAETVDTAGRLFSYSYGYDFSRNEGATDPRSLSLETDTGIRLGSTRTELRESYGDDLEEAYNAAADTWTWAVDSTEEGHVRGLLSGPEDEATVVLIERAPGCEIG